MKNKLIAIAIFIALELSAYCAAISYVLLPGSTITPVSGATPIGPTESLVGTFDWIYNSPDGSHSFLDAVSLDLFSSSFHLTLQIGNNVATGISASNVLFLENVNMTGLSIPVGQISSIVSGTYAGPITAPTFVSFPQLGITPPSGSGLYVAKLSFTAQQVPEPSVAFLVAFGIFAAFMKMGKKGKGSWFIT